MGTENIDTRRQTTGGGAKDETKNKRGPTMQTTAGEGTQCKGRSVEIHDAARHTKLQLVNIHRGRREQVSLKALERFLLLIRRMRAPVVRKTE